MLAALTHACSNSAPYREFGLNQYGLSSPGAGGGAGGGPLVTKLFDTVTALPVNAGTLALRKLDAIHSGRRGI